MNRSPSFWLHLTIERHLGQTQSGAHLWQVFHARWGQTFHARWGQAFHAHWADLHRDSAESVKLSASPTPMPKSFGKSFPSTIEFSGQTWGIRGPNRVMRQGQAQDRLWRAHGFVNSLRVWHEKRQLKGEVTVLTAPWGAGASLLKGVQEL